MSEEEEPSWAQLSAWTTEFDDRRSTSERGLGSGLCSRCSHGRAYRRNGRSEVTTYCHLGGNPTPMPSDVEECTDHTSRKPRLSLDEMYAIGLKIDKRKAGGQYL